MRRAGRRVALALAAALVLAAPGAVRAEIRHVQVEGVAPAPADGAPAAGSLRQAALDDALQKAVLQVGAEVAGSAASATAGPDAPDPLAALRADVADHVLRYRVLQDLGLRPASTPGAPPGAQEYAVRAEVVVDAERVAHTLRAAGVVRATPEAGGPQVVHVVVDRPPSWGACARLRDALLDRGATRVTPEFFDPERAVWRVEGPWSPADLRALLEAEPPEGVAIESAVVDGESVALWLRDLAPPAEEPAGDAPSGPP